MSAPTVEKFQNVAICGHNWLKATYSNGEVAYGIEIGHRQYRIARATLDKSKWQADQRDLGAFWAALPSEPVKTVQEAAKAILAYDKARTGPGA